MTHIPIQHMTLYKHGVGFYVRRGPAEGETISLSFKEEAMNDILKSLTILDLKDGQILGLDYPTPKDKEERLEGSSVYLDKLRTLRTLVTSLTGRQVRIHLDFDEERTGVLLGLDEVPGENALEKSQIVLLQGDSATVASLKRIRAITLLDAVAQEDLAYFLATTLEKERIQEVRLRLSPGEHDLSISYVAPAPTWRVSYRLVLPGEEDKEALLIGWGIFDNQLDEDLEDISLVLVAGMPISFVYDLYTPHTPERPIVEEEDRVAAGPVEFAGIYDEDSSPQYAVMESRSAPRMAKMLAPPMAMDQLASAVPVSTEGKSLGELFEYRISTPVSVRRGQSASVPITLTRLKFKKDLLYNAEKFMGTPYSDRPIATLRMKNLSGLTLERGPVTVSSEDNYLGEAILPFTPEEAEITVPYAVELSVKVREQRGSERQVNRLVLKGAYLLFEEWVIHWRRYQLNNSTAAPVSVLVEHPRAAHHELFETPKPAEQTDEHLRFAVPVPPRGEAVLTVKERRLEKRHEEIQRQSYNSLQEYLKRGLISKDAHQALSTLLGLWEKIADKEKNLLTIEKDREKIYRSQEQIRGNLQALGGTGKEGELRGQFIQKLAASEETLTSAAGQEEALRKETSALKQEIERLLSRLG